jgi:hypothetical protein
LRRRKFWSFWPSSANFLTTPAELLDRVIWRVSKQIRNLAIHDVILSQFHWRRITNSAHRPLSPGNIFHLHFFKIFLEGLKKPKNHSDTVIWHVRPDLRGFSFVRDAQRHSNANGKDDPSQFSQFIIFQTTK